MTRPDTHRGLAARRSAQVDPSRAAAWRMVAVVSLLGSCGGDEQDQVDLTLVPTVSIAADVFIASPRLSLDSMGAVCPRDRVRCPNEELILGDRASDGDVAIATRSGAVFLIARDAVVAEQIVFDKHQTRRLAFGGSLEAVGDSLWRLHLPDALRRVTFDDRGHAVHQDVARIEMGYAGSAATGDYFTQLLVPGADRLDDSVRARFERIAPRRVAGALAATRRMRASFQKGSDMSPLSPFFDVAPVWTVTPGGGIAFSPALTYRIEFHGDSGALRVLAVDATLRAVTDEDLDAVVAKFMSGIPGNERFQAAAAADADRRRRLAPPNHAAITDLRFAPSGDFLVRGDPGVADDSVRWDAFSPDLVLRGHFLLAAIDRVLLFRNDSILLARPTGSHYNAVIWTRLRPPPSHPD